MIYIMVIHPVIFLFQCICIPFELWEIKLWTETELNWVRCANYCLTSCLSKFYFVLTAVQSTVQSNDTKIPCVTLMSAELRIQILWLANRLNLFEQLFKQVTAYVNWSKLKHRLFATLRLHRLISFAKVCFFIIFVWQLFRVAELQTYLILNFCGLASS